MPLALPEIDKQKVGFFRFKELNGQYLITNDIGDYSFLTPQEFESFLSGKTEQSFPQKYQELQSKGFIRDRLDFDGLAQKYAKKNMFLGQGTSLHIVVVTLRCDHKCVYCQAGSQPLSAKGLDMDIPTAQKVVDRIFESPSQDITIEFQGGEPLINWGTVKFITEYARKKNKTANRRLLISLVSNLAFMTKGRLRFLMANNVGLCTSLDGPMRLHNKNRLATIKKNAGYGNAARWLKIIPQERKKYKNYRPGQNALATITKDSLRYPKEIIDAYIGLGLDGVHLRPVNPFGISKRIWQKISYSPEDFFNFYKCALDYIIKLNLQGKKFCERTALIFLTKILTDKDPNFLDVRSPCGAGIGQLAYNFNGDVYTCDEGRMLSRLGDESFKIGNVRQDNYEDFINNEVVKVLSLASCLDNLAGCSECVYKPYCGVCPLDNYAERINMFKQNTERCQIYRSVLNCLFAKLQDPKIKTVFYKWLTG